MTKTSASAAACSATDRMPAASIGRRVAWSIAILLERRPHADIAGAAGCREGEHLLVLLVERVLDPPEDLQPVGQLVRAGEADQRVLVEDEARVGCGNGKKTKSRVLPL